MIARFITHMDYELYRRNGWRLTFYGVRGDDLHCFVASFRCCHAG